MSEGNGFATRDSVIGRAPQRRFTQIEIAGHGKFRLQSLSVMEANGIQAHFLIQDSPENKVREIASTNCRWIAKCVVDADGNRQFKDDDVESLLECDAAFINALAAACINHCDDEKSVEAAEKN